jgi:type I restriction enzyme S subunit
VSAVLTAQEPSAKYLVNVQPPLVRHFDLVAQAPGGVARLRELILTLAVQGKLVPQDPSDEPASELLKKIRVEKDRLIAEGKTKRDKPLVEITDEEKPFELPEGWVWVRNSNLFSLRKGKVPKNISDKPEGFPYLDIDALDRNILKRYSTDASAPMCTCEDILVVCDGSRSGLVLQGQDGIVGSTLSVVDTAKQIQSFIQLIFQAGFNRYNSGMKGAAIPHLDTKVVLAEVIGLPPLDEQSRIVTRVEELMQLCDALEASGQLEAQQHAQLVNTLLGTLTQSETPEALADNWQRIATHFDVLLDRPEALDTLEQTILQLAVRGLLVPQDPTDEPASVLLQKIRTEKDHLIAQGKSNRGKPSSSIPEKEKKFQLPQSWEWTPLVDIAHKGPTNGVSPRPQELPTNVRCLSLSATTQGVFKSECFKYVDVESRVAEQFFLKTGDLLIQRGNSIDYVGIAAVYDGLDDEFIYPDLMMRLQLSKLVDTAFIHIALVCKEGRSYFRDNATGTQGTMPKVNQATVAGAPIPLPPFGEQRRIVICVNELRSICSDLRQYLAAGQTVQSHLANALVTA